MEASAESMSHAGAHPVTITVQPALAQRNRLTTFFRFFLALPHLILVGGPLATMSWTMQKGSSVGFGSGSGILGAVACVGAFIAWFAILLTGRHPGWAWKLGAWYLRWRVRAIAYATLLRDDYPPFGDESYPAELVLPAQEGPRDRLTVAFRILLALPHFIVLGLLSVIWALTTAIAWVMILVTGRYPDTLYGFAIGVLAWDVRVEAYMLLLRDEYPPFSLRV